MEDKYNVSSYLDKFMPKTTVQINEETKHITDAEAPSVKGYFKLISLRYMKRVKDIKKLCVDYVNTYIDGALNVAEKMDDVKLAESRDSLAKDIKFELEGFSTGGGTKGAQSKAGVAFLVGDKALKDKLNAILSQIDLRASKSPILKNWADLMVLQSKVLATNKLYKLTNDMIDEEKYKSSEKDTDSVLNDIDDLMKDVEDSQTGYQKEVTEEMTKYGTRDEWISDKNIKTYDILKKYVNPVDKSNINNTGEDDEITKLRKDFNDQYANGNTIKSYEAFPGAINDKELDLSDSEKQYLIACMAVNNISVTGKHIATPIDIALAMANCVNKDKLIDKEKVADVDLGVLEFGKENLNHDKTTDASQKLGITKDFENKLRYAYETMFVRDGDVKDIGEKIHIKTPAEFINEQLFNTYMELKDMELTMMDILDDCDGGCMYIGNFPSIKEGDVDYVMLDGNGSFGFYKENGNLDLALEYGQPQDISLVEFSDSQRKAVLSTILDYISDDVFGKLS